MKRDFKVKFIITLFLAILSMSIFTPFAFAAIDKEYLNPAQFEDSSYNQAANFKFQEGHRTIGEFLQNAFGVILTIVRTIAVGWALMMLVSISTKYMSASPEVKAQLKVDVPTHLIGAAILFGASGILTIIQYFVEDTFK